MVSYSVRNRENIVIPEKPPTPGGWSRSGSSCCGTSWPGTWVGLMPCKSRRAAVVLLWARRRRRRAREAQPRAPGSFLPTWTMEVRSRRAGSGRRGSRWRCRWGPGKTERSGEPACRCVGRRVPAECGARRRRQRRGRVMPGFF